ncbi:MAG: hypothetical protein AAFR52_05940 [Pseudomonadota bacterium]
MVDEPKGSPGGGPAVPGELAERLYRLATDPAARRASGLKLAIHGGLAAERFKLDIDARGDGEMSCDIDCAITHRKAAGKGLRIDPERVTEVFRDLDADMLAALGERQGGFPPCSLIGRLDLDLEGEAVTGFFMADEEQAREAGYEMPPPLRKAVHMLYEEAEKGLGVGSVRP